SAANLPGGFEIMLRYRLLACAALAAFGAVSVAAAPPAEAQTRRVTAAQPLQRAVTFATEVGAPDGVLVLPLASEADLATRGASLSETERAAITRALASDEFNYGARSTLTLRGISEWD